LEYNQSQTHVVFIACAVLCPERNESISADWGGGGGGERTVFCNVADPDPDQNVTDPEHRDILSITAKEGAEGTLFKVDEGKNKVN
jgi:hypothetical protein